MRIVKALPPMIDEIDAVFDVRGKPVLFPWGDKIFNAQSGTARGEDAIRQWWHRYITDPAFLLAEEFPAHFAEFNSLCEQHRHKWHSERNMRRTFAAHVARRLSAPLYGRIISFEVAKHAILKAA